MTEALMTLAEKLNWLARLIIILSLGILAWYALDREPPFAILSVEPAQARPGETLTITGKVRRDIMRKCSADFSRYIYAANGARFDLGQSFASVAMVERLEKQTPGRLVVTFRLPDQMAAGPAVLVTTLQYVCNPVHRLFWPIPVETELPFTVLEP